MSEETYKAIPKKQNSLAPNPTLNYEKCTTCGKCIDFCHAQSFGFETKGGKKKTVVKNLNACVVLYRGCEDICPAGAITHQSEEETKQSIAKLQEAALS